MTQRRWLIPVGTIEQTAAARAAVDGVRTHAPGDAAVVLWCDHGDVPEPLAAADARLTPADLGISADALGILRASYRPGELPWLLVPTALLHLTEQPGPVAVLAPEVQLCGPTDAIWAQDAAEVRAFTVTSSVRPSPVTRPDPTSGYLPPQHPISAYKFETWGLVSGLLWSVADRAAAGAVAETWPFDLDAPPPAEDTRPDVIAPAGLEVLAFHGRAAVQSTPAVLLSAPALVGRELTHEGGVLRSDGEPVVAVGFPGFDPHHPEVLSPGRLDVRLSEHPALVTVTRARAAAMLAHEVEHPNREGRSTELGIHDELPNGAILEKWTRRLVRAGVRAGKITRSPFSAEGLAQLETYFREPASRGGSLGINRALLAFWSARLELQRAYPVLDGPDAHGLIGWANVFGPDAGFPTCFAPPRVEPATHERSSAPDTPGVNLAGYFTSELGLGEGARQLATALRSAGEPLTAIQGLVRPATRQEAEFVPEPPAAADHDVNLLVVNGDIVPSFAEDVGDAFFAGRRTAALWWWECEPFPIDEWRAALQWVDEIYVGTAFVKDLIAPHVDVPVRQFPMPVSLVPSAPLPRSEFGIPDDVPMFFYMWDYHSSEVRKNPSGLARAFKEAFPEPGEAVLVLKCINHHNLPEAHERVLLEIAGRPDIILVDRFLPSNAKNRLMELCDCYVSPHRSEGFGHTPAEAMLLGKPVIATGYGGNLDYMAPDRGILLDYELVTIGKAAAPYPAHGVWADPDHAQLVEKLRWVAEHPEEARAMGERARKYIEEHHSPEATGRALRGLLAQTRAAAPSPERGDPGAGGSARRARELGRRAARRGAQSVPGAGKVRRKARSVAQRIADKLTIDLRNGLRDVNARVDQANADHHVEVVAQAQFRADISEHIEISKDELRADHAAIANKVIDHLDRHAAQPWLTPDAGVEFRDDPILGRVMAADRSEGTGDRYADFLAMFRGPYDRVLELMTPYRDVLRGQGPLLDIGCGRGELLEIAASAGIEAHGVDLDVELIRQAIERGHSAEAGDGIAVLERAADDSLGAVSAIHVIEHLEVDALSTLFGEALRALRPGGVLITETINPHEVSAATTFWVDPTHEGPVFPQVAMALALSVGFGEVAVFAPDGTGDWEADRLTSTRYTLVARR